MARSGQGLREELARSRLQSEELGIDLADGTDDAAFRWFLASLLYGGRIRGSVATCTYESFVLHGLTTPQAILDAGWAYLVNPVMRLGGYIRYDESKSRQVLRDCRKLMDEYEGSLRLLHERASGPRDLEARIDAFYGVGPVTTNIFLRELRPFWPKADPAPLPWVLELADELGVDLAGLPRKSLRFARVEAGLVRRKLSGGRPSGMKRYGCAARRRLAQGAAPGAPLPGRPGAGDARL